MCNYCGSKREKYAYCVRCGKEICEDCASSVNKLVHRECQDRLPKPNNTDVAKGIGVGPGAYQGTRAAPGIKR